MQPYAFQSLKPICGVSASLLSSAAAGCAVPREMRGAVTASNTAENTSAKVRRRDGSGGSGRRPLALAVVMGMGHRLLVGGAEEQVQDGGTGRVAVLRHLREDHRLPRCWRGLSGSRPR
ncbi:hypothetical protein SY2F82_39070 [Streptomyces sp. Y2F8-2]|nr:hypothetical protein SY2F82_39070 [Streptomyces sp. Y2F8-2]